MATAGCDDLRRRLREADAEELAELVERCGTEIDVPLARQIFRNPFVSGETIAVVVELPALAGTYEILRRAAGHPRAPRLLALRCLGGLHWADLARVSADSRLHPAVRRAADRRLIERLPKLAVGERSALARTASAPVLAFLRMDPVPRVLAAMLENPRLTEGVLLPLAASGRARPLCLATLATNARWSRRRAIRLALCRNPATPSEHARGLLPGLSAAELAVVAADHVVPAQIRGAARRLVDERRRPVRRRPGN
jgi:hypothetical protein